MKDQKQNYPYQEFAQSLQRRKSASRLAQYRNDDSLAHIMNPGARLYQRGIKMNQDKEQFIQIARK